MSRIDLAGLEATEALGKRLGAVLRAGDVVLLEGPLGAGKTALVRAITRGLGSDDEVVSPTFVLVRHYRGRLPVVHADLYRLEGPEAVARLGLLELADDGVLAVEWADRVPGFGGPDALHLRLHPGAGENDRTVEVLATPRHLAAAVAPSS